jgi:hypothetical protein
MALGLRARNQRRSPRVDVLLRVKGELVPVRFPITIFNLNRTGFAVLSEVRFRAGERLDFRLTGIRGPSVLVTAAAVHIESRPNSSGLFLTGFVFQPGRQDGVVPEAAIRQLIVAVAPKGFKA